MNNNSISQKTILCYGDSNTWGYVPVANHQATKMRYARDERWPGILQTLLGNEKYYVVEEGLNSRTTNIDHALPPDRNGKNYLAPCLYSHAPLDLVILALGGNDTKTYFNRTARQIKNAMAELIDIIQMSNYGPALQTSPKILLLSPAIPFTFIENFQDENGEFFLRGSVDKMRELISLYAELANEKSCFYLDLSQIKPSEIDGVHYDKNAHRDCALSIYSKVEEIFSK